MRWMKYAGRMLGLSMVLMMNVEAGSVIDKPATMPEAMVTITVSDLQGLIDGVGEVVSQVSPMMNGMMLKSLIGMQLGDPQFTGIAQGKGLAVIALDPTNIFAVIEVTEAQSGTYSNLVVSKGMQAKYKNGLLVLGQTPAVLEKGMGLADSVQVSLLAKRSPTLRIVAQPAVLVEKNETQIQAAIGQISSMMNIGMSQVATTNAPSMEGVEKILEGELRVLLSVARQCDAVEIVLTPGKEGVRLDKIIVPKTGSRLATLCNAPKRSTSSPKLQSNVLGEGMLLVDFSMSNPDALADFVTAETELLFKEMKLEENEFSAMAENMVKWLRIITGPGCEVVGFDAEGGMSVGYLFAVKDGSAALALFKSMEQDMAPFLKWYKEMGMEISFEFEENDREYKDIQIHRMEFDMDQMPEKSREQMKAIKMNDMNYDIALFDGLVLCTMGTNKIEGVIDRLKDPAFKSTSLKARGVYPDGGFYYFDYDIGQYITCISSFMSAVGENPIPPQMQSLLQDVGSITSAGFREDGRVMWSVNVPNELIGKIGQAAMMMQMQQMQGGRPPASAPQQQGQGDK